MRISHLQLMSWIIIFSLSFISESMPSSGFTPEYLARIKNSDEAKAIRDIFFKASKHDNECPKCKEFFPNSRKYQTLLSKEFVTVTYNPGGFGGFFLLVVFKNTSEIYRIWVYKIDSCEFQIREMEADRPLNEKLAGKLKDKAYLPNWVQATPMKCESKQNSG